MYTRIFSHAPIVLFIVIVIDIALGITIITIVFMIVIVIVIVNAIFMNAAHVIVNVFDIVIVIFSGIDNVSPPQDFLS